MGLVDLQKLILIDKQEGTEIKTKKKENTFSGKTTRMNTMNAFILITCNREGIAMSDTRVMDKLHCNAMHQSINLGISFY